MYFDNYFPFLIPFLIAFWNKNTYNVLAYSTLIFLKGNTMKVSQLQYFTTLAELQNMSRASELLHMSQSSLSKNISAVEEELGVTLFDRNGKHISLNSAGQRFLDCCHHILNEYESAVDEITAMSTGTTTRIKIGACGNINRLLPIMTAFKKTHPEVEFDINSDIEHEDNIDINEYDVLVYPSESKYSRFSGFPLFEEKYFLAVSNNNPLRKSAAVSVKSLNSQDAVFMRSGSLNEYSYNLCSALSVHFTSASFVTSRAMHREAIASGLAVGFVPDSYRSLYISTGNIELLPITDAGFTRQYNICFKRKKHLSQLAQEFEALICKQLKIDVDAI